MAKRSLSGRGWRGPQYPGEFPTLGYQVADLIQTAAVIPDGERAGDPYILTDEMLRFTLWFYRIDPVTGRFYFERGAQLIRPQKWGKGPFGAAIICAEAHPEGPVRFDGWNADGEPVGKPVATPWIQVTAVSEDQTDNVWTALQPMIELGSLRADIDDTGLTRINLPSGGKIEPVTSSAHSRLGQRLTFALQDQTESWYEKNGGRKVADNQRRNLGGMGGRWLETPNAWDPSEQSVAQQTYEAQEPGVYFDDADAGPGSVKNKADRRRMLKKVYGDSATAPPDAPWKPWVDIDRIDLEIVALLPRDPAQAERWYLNRKEASEARAFNVEKYKMLADPEYRPAKGALAVAGVDGALYRDALAIVAQEVVTGFQWPIGIWERPPNAPDDYEHPVEEIDGAMLDFFDEFDVWRVYIDKQWIDVLFNRWQGRWGDKRVLPWATHRPRQMAWAVRNYTSAIHGAADALERARKDQKKDFERLKALRRLPFRHNGDPVMERHMRNAHKQKVNVMDDRQQRMHVIAKDRDDSPHKMDGAAAGTLAQECRGDAIAAGMGAGRQKLDLSAYRIETL